MFTRSWEVRFPSGNTFLVVPELKLLTMLESSARICSSSMYTLTISINTFWSIDAKNFRISHLSIQQVRVSFCETCRANMRRSEEHTSELQSQFHLVCRLLLEKKK